MYVRRRLSIFFTCLVIFVVTVTCKSPFTSDKRVQATSFQTPMRYGRSGMPTKNKVIVSPRADNFYIGPRYGKRSSDDGMAETYGRYSPTTEFGRRQQQAIITSGGGLACVYTGVANIYRCDERKYPANENLLSSN